LYYNNLNIGIDHHIVLQ